MPASSASRRTRSSPQSSRLEVGFHVSAHDYLQATRLRARAARTFVAEVFSRVDVVVAPTIPTPAPLLAAVKTEHPTRSSVAWATSLV